MRVWQSHASNLCLQHCRLRKLSPRFDKNLIISVECSVLLPIVDYVVEVKLPADLPDDLFVPTSRVARTVEVVVLDRVGERVVGQQHAQGASEVSEPVLGKSFVEGLVVLVRDVNTIEAMSFDEPSQPLSASLGIKFGCCWGLGFPKSTNNNLFSFLLVVLFKNSLDVAIFLPESIA